MKNFILLAGILIIILSINVNSHAQTTMMGGKGLLRTFDAEPVAPGLLYVSPYVLTFLDIPEGSSSVTKDHTVNVGITVGLSRVLEIILQAVPYQDDQHGPWAPPGDTRVGLKFHPQGKRVTQFGLVGFVNLPTAEYHNIQYEPFSYDAVGWGLLGLCTLDFRNTSSSIPLKMHINLGYQDHDASDRYFSDEKDQLLFGLAFKFPIRTTILYSEFTGEIFINNTQYVPLSENSLRFSQGFRFVGPWHLVFDLAGDVNLSQFSGTENVGDSHRYLKRYADWKIILGATWSTSIFRYMTKEEKMERKRLRDENLKREQIRKEREKASKELDKIKKDLEKSKNESSQP